MQGIHGRGGDKPVARLDNGNNRDEFWNDADNCISYSSTNLKLLTKTYFSTVEKHNRVKRDMRKSSTPRKQEPRNNSDSQIDDIEELHQLVSRQERDLNNIRLALTRAEAQRDEAKRQLTQILATNALGEHDQQSHQAAHQRDSIVDSIQVNMNNATQHGADGKNIICTINNIVIGGNTLNHNVVNPRQSQGPKYQTPRRKNITQAAVIKEARCRKLSLIKSRPLVEHLTESYRAALPAPDGNKLVQDNEILQKSLARLNAQNEVLHHNLRDSQNVSQTLDLSLSQEECNRALLVQACDLCKLRSQMSDQLIVLSQNELILSKLHDKLRHQPHAANAGFTAQLTKAAQEKIAIYRQAEQLRLKILDKLNFDRQRASSYPAIVSMEDKQIIAAASLPDVISTLQKLVAELDSDVQRLISLVVVPVKKQTKPLKKALSKDSAIGEGNDVNAQHSIEMSVLLEEMMMLKEQIAKLQGSVNRTEQDKAPSHAHLALLPVEKSQDVLMRNKVLELEDSLVREEKLKDQLSTLRGTLNRLQATSREQQAHSTRFIQDLKKQNHDLKTAMKHVKKDVTKRVSGEHNNGDSVTRIKHLV